MFYNPQRTLQISLKLWWDVDGGFSNLAWLPQASVLLPAAFAFSFLNVPNFAIQAVTYCLILIIGGISLYFLVFDLLKTHPDVKLVAFISGLFYIFNPYSVSQIWSRSLTDQAFSFALLPLGVFLFWKGLTSRKWIYLVYFAFSTIMLSAAFGVASFILTFWSVIAVAFLYWVVLHIKNLRALVFGLFYFSGSFLLWFLGNAWWTLPTFLTGNLIYSRNLSNATENISTLIGVSNYYPFDWLIRLLQKHYYIDSQPFGHIYEMAPFQVISWLVPIFLFFGLVAFWKKKETKSARLLIVIFLVGLVISLGASWPFGGLFIWIFESFPTLQAFRNPYEKYGIVYAMAYSPIFALGLVELVKNPRQMLESITPFNLKSAFKLNLWPKILIIIFFLSLICGLYAWPMWTGKLISGPDRQIGIQVPSYYQDLNNWLKLRNEQKERIFMTPLLEGEGAIYHWQNLVYNGADPMTFILDVPVVSSSPVFPFYDFARSFQIYFEGKPVADALALLRVRYLVNRTDLQNVTEVSKNQIHRLTEQYYQPGNISNLGQVSCVDTADDNIGKPAPVICRVNPKYREFNNVKFLHILLRSDKDASLDISLLDSKGSFRRWYALTKGEYRVDAQKQEQVIIPLGTPTEGFEINLSDITSLSIGAHPLDDQNSWVSNLSIKGVWVDKGTAIPVHNYEFVQDFDKLALYKASNLPTPPLVGILDQVQFVGDFENFFDSASYDKEHLDKIGLLVVSQNQDKDLSNITTNLGQRIIQVQEYRDNIFWLQTATSQPTNILLSQNYHQGWKVIEGVEKSEIDGNLLNLISLVNRKYLPETNHFVINGYANLWRSSGSSSQYAVVFLPQLWANIGEKVSLYTITGFVIVILSSWVKKIKRNLYAD